MKKLFFTLAMMLVGSTVAWADNPYLTIDPFTITSATGNNFVKVRIHCDAADTKDFDYLDLNTYESTTLTGTRFTAFQCSIILPDGLSFKKLGSVYAVKSQEFSKAVEFSIGQRQFTNDDGKEQLNLVVYSTQNAPLYPIVLGDETETANNFLFQFAVLPKNESAYGKYEMEAVKIIIAPAANQDGTIPEGGAGSVYQDNFQTLGSYPLTLDEGKAFPTWDGTLANVDVNMKRTIKAGYNTVCFPFAMTGEEVATTFGAGSQAYSYSEAAGQISFAKADGIEANVPVLLNATSPASTFTLADKTVEAPSDLAVSGDTYDFVGNYTPALTIAAGNYVLSNGSVVKSLGGSTLNGMRAFFAKKGAEAKSLSMDIEGEATGIQFVNGEVETVGDIYTVGGQLVRRNSTVKGLPEGIYMINGNKVVVRK
jgi:hypothetical protein